MTLGQAVRACRDGRATQVQVIERVAELGLTLGQTTLSSYERGETVPTVVMSAAIERACGRPLGWIAIQAGYVTDVCTVPEAIAVDPKLDDIGRGIVTAAYQSQVKPRP